MDAGIILCGAGFERGIFGADQHHFTPPYPDVIHVVRDTTGAVDILDTKTDAPKPGEESFAFRLDRESLAHICFRDSKKGADGWYVAYDEVDEPVPAPPGKMERTEPS